MAGDLGDELREYEANAASSRRQDPKAILRDLAENSPSEATKLSAARALIELNAEERARREEGKDENPLLDLEDRTLEQIVDSNMAGDLQALLNAKSTLYPRERFPQAHRVVDTILARRIEGEVAARVSAALAVNADAAEFERRVDEAARERAAQLAEEAIAARRAEFEAQARRLAGEEAPAVNGAGGDPPGRLGPVWVEDRRQGSDLLQCPA